jgi:hypothetical protein
MRRATTTITAIAAFLALVVCPIHARAQEDDENPLDQPPPTDQPAPVKPVDEPATPPEPQPPPEPVDPPMLVLGLGAGVYIPTSALGANVLVGIDAAYQLPWFGGRFGVGAGLAYSQPTTSGTMEDDRVPRGFYDYDSVMRELVLDILFTFRVFDWGSSWSPHAGIGPVIYFLSHEVSALGHDQTETSTQAGFLFTAGIDYRLGPGALVGEVRVPFALVGQRTTGESNVGAVSIVLGYRFRI